ncbi:MAG: DUF2442 domain-containing protein [Bacteroidota bacterium]
MNPRVEEVVEDQNFTLLITFKNGEKKRFDVKPYLDTGIFSELKEPGIFYSVKPFMGSIEWSNGADLCPDTLYLDGEKY